MLIVAVRETAGSALYGILDVLEATGNIWQTLLRSGDTQQYFRVRIVSLTAPVHLRQPYSGQPKRRFKSATGLPLIDYLQNVRIEHGKHLLETTQLPVEEISVQAAIRMYRFREIVQSPGRPDSPHLPTDVRQVRRNRLPLNQGEGWPSCPLPQAPLRQSVCDGAQGGACGGERSC